MERPRHTRPIHTARALRAAAFASLAALAAPASAQSLEDGFVITPEGVGIGTTTPRAKLHVEGEGFVGGGLRVTENLGVGNFLTDGGGPLESLEVRGRDSGGGRFIVSDGDGTSRQVILLQAPSIATPFARLLSHRYGDMTTDNPGPNLVINEYEHSGNVGIRTTDPQAALDVNGSFKHRGLHHNPLLNTNENYTVSSRYHFEFSSEAGSLMMRVPDEVISEYCGDIDGCRIRIRIEHLEQEQAMDMQKSIVEFVYFSDPVAAAKGKGGPALPAARLIPLQPEGNAVISHPQCSLSFNANNTHVLHMLNELKIIAPNTRVNYLPRRCHLTIMD